MGMPGMGAMGIGGVGSAKMGGEGDTTTLVVVVSKTFTTAETMLNARTIKARWAYEIESSSEGNM